jgi:hypothetical protein
MATDPDTVVPINTELPQGSNWQPVIGDEARDLVNRKLAHESQETRDALLASSASILAKSVPPEAAAGSATGLVIGYVQSGKTLSFTTVMALARDNGFQLVIVVAGISRPLLNQSTQRLRRDLRIDDVDGPLRWKLYTNPTDNENNRRHIEQTLADWRDEDVPQAERATVLITVMKQHTHLRGLISLLQNLDLEGVPTLIIDDEADQASLNTLVARGQESPTYRRLLEMRDAIPHHTFLQYTATPQAPLLINIIDALSPDFAEVLEPGADYTGGAAFFQAHPELVEVIDPSDIPTDNNPLHDPPEPLLEALRIFLLGVAAGQAEGRSARNPNRSMLVHPSQRRDSHAEYHRWISDVFDEWQRILRLPEDDSDRLDLMEDMQVAYDNLASTVDNLPPFEELLRRLPRAFRDTKIEEVNTRGQQTPIIDWSQSYGWILVGGQAMDRGFTVEGLTVTYMPRGPGVGNADTVQQRGRFFGYKRRYLGYCRVYLELAALNAFQEYVEHEEIMRRLLEEWQESGRPLSEWKRAFVLSPALQPCRRNVLEHGFSRGDYANRWFYPAYLLAPAEVTAENRATVDSFLASLSLAPEAGSEAREAAQRHLVQRDLSLASVVESLIVPFRVTGPRDTTELIGVMLQLSEGLRANGNERCTVFQMSPDFPRQRATDQNGRINELFQGPTRVTGGGYSYPGDSAFRDEDFVTVQIHSLNLRQDDVTVAESVPAIAIWLPARFEIDWIAQHQPS